MQTVHTEEIFNALSQRGIFSRKALFCSKCIDQARSYVLFCRQNNQMNVSANTNSPISVNNSVETFGFETRKSYFDYKAS